MADTQAAEAANQPVKYTVMLIPQAMAALASAAALTHVTRTDTVNRALQVYEFLQQQMAAGKEIMLVDADGTVERVKIF